MSMGNGESARLRKASVLRFGEIARKLGFITDAALREALESQHARVERGESHKLLGLILLELGHIDNRQLIDILREFEAGESRGRLAQAV